MIGQPPEAPRDLLDELESVCDLLESPATSSAVRPAPESCPPTASSSQADLFATPAPSTQSANAREFDELIDALVAEHLPRLEQELRRRLAEHLKSGSGQ